MSAGADSSSNCKSAVLQDAILAVHRVERLADFPRLLCEMLPRLLDGEIASYCDSRGGLHAIPWREHDEAWIPQGQGVMMFTRTDPTFSSLRENFLDMVPQQPLYSKFWHTRDGAAKRISDAQTLTKFRDTRLYAEIYRPMGVDREITIYLPTPPRGVTTIAVSRQRKDFSDDEVRRLEWLRPHLELALRRLLAREASPDGPSARDSLFLLRSQAEIVSALQRAGLTSKQAEVLRWIMQGKTNPEIAALLGCQPLTVKTHVAHILLRLKARTRTEAAMKAREWLERS